MERKIRTDLACEERDLLRASAGETTELKGVKATDEMRNGFRVTTVDILDKDGEEALCKPVGRYVTVELDALLRRAENSFEQAAQLYADFYFQHMTLEEKHILPLAEKMLTEQDWADLDAAFAANRDPLTGHEPDDDYRALFSRIVNALPAPLGLGEAR